MYQIGDRVILRSNEDEPLRVGNIKRFEYWNETSSTRLPIVECDDGTELLCMCCVVHYTEDLENLLKNFTPKEQWDILSKNPTRFAVWESKRPEHKRTIEIPAEVLSQLRKACEKPSWLKRFLLTFK